MKGRTRELRPLGTPLRFLTLPLERRVNERRLKMNRAMKQGLIAAVLLSGAGIISAPAWANSIHDEGYFGGGYTSIGPGPYY